MAENRKAEDIVSWQLKILKLHLSEAAKRAGEGKPWLIEIGGTENGQPFFRIGELARVGELDLDKGQKRIGCFVDVKHTEVNGQTYIKHYPFISFGTTVNQIQEFEPKSSRDGTMLFSIPAVSGNVTNPMEVLGHLVMCYGAGNALALFNGASQYVDGKYQFENDPVISRNYALLGRGILQCAESETAEAWVAEVLRETKGDAKAEEARLDVLEKGVNAMEAITAGMADGKSYGEILDGLRVNKSEREFNEIFGIVKDYHKDGESLGYFKQINDKIDEKTKFAAKEAAKNS
ncbi:MAG: hypothetical protein FWE53_01940 [Firmicutes bacterium]|nr:hypothetical protein [Bacillota bacterium]